MQNDRSADRSCCQLLKCFVAASVASTVAANPVTKQLCMAGPVKLALLLGKTVDPPHRPQSRAYPLLRGKSRTSISIDVWLLPLERQPDSQ